MASELSVGDSVPDSVEPGCSDDQKYIDRVKKFLKPLENRWDYVQSVLLWEKPIHSLCYFIVMTALFGSVASGRFRVVLLLVVIIASSLLIDDVRSKVRLLLLAGGFGEVSDEDSRDTTLSFSRLCERLAAIWSFFMTWFERVNRMKSENIYKYYGVLFGLLLAVVFAYQYLPLMKIFYLSACALYFWPVIKHHGIHKRVKKTLDPFYMPFVVQWQHTRTKRQRDVSAKVISGEQPGNSDDEFAEDLRPLVEETTVNQDVTLRESEPSSSEPPTPEPPLQVKFLEKVIASAVSQGLSSLTEFSQNQNDDDSTQAATSGNSSPDAESFDSPSLILDSLQFPSISQAGDTLEFEEGEFMKGLEFPDIGKDSDSETENVHPVSRSEVDSKPKTVEIEQMQTKEPIDRVNSQTASRTPESALTSSANMDVSDYEMLDQSEAEGMAPTDETDNVDSQSGLGSVTNYVGKWLGY
ncbi:unnamed protein product [Porites lobata]|uniref:RETREG1-3/ARL6IP-like N-terminal reticulon-homology domain-containing protein n=1 Tax=Porites lobata TaxID=104759 RepID=A0ABN8PPN1_9CNID|nr:unnamed protein product [Porites lobata]